MRVALPPCGRRQEKEAPMEMFKCQQCGKKFNNQEELRKHEQECVPARVK
jgi:transposase-like protein